MVNQFSLSSRFLRAALVAQLESVYRMGIKRKQQSSQMVLDLHFIRISCRRAPQMKGFSLGTKITKEADLGLKMLEKGDE